MDTEGIILAAGLSKRTGAYKMLLDLGGSTVVEMCINGMYEYCSRLTVVGGYRFEELSYLESKYPKLELIYNSGFRKGMFTSVLKGLENVRADRTFLIPGDCPSVPGTVYDKMLRCSSDIAVPVYGGRKGHPVLMKRAAFGKLLDNPAYESLRDFTAEYGFEAVEVGESGILADLDTMEDYCVLLKTYESRTDKVPKWSG